MSFTAENEKFKVNSFCEFSRLSQSLKYSQCFHHIPKGFLLHMNSPYFKKCYLTSLFNPFCKEIGREKIQSVLVERTSDVTATNTKELDAS